MDNDGVEIFNPKNETRFKHARAGDHLMCPFQCPECHMRNMEMRDLDLTCPFDQEVEQFIMRATLDAFWSREVTTVEKNKAIGERLEKTMARLRLSPATPPMGPYPLEDTFGMKAAICVLDRSLDQGHYERFVQFETFRKTRSAITNITQAGAGGLSDVVGAYEQERVWISHVPTHSFWFSTRFMVGLHKRVGDI